MSLWGILQNWEKTVLLISLLTLAECCGSWSKPHPLQEPIHSPLLVGYCGLDLQNWVPFDHFYSLIFLCFS